MTVNRETSRGRIASVLLIVGFLSLVGAVAAARGAPATGYEVDIYAATPAAFWAASAVSLAAAFAVALLWPARRSAYLLAGGTLLAIVAMPVIRGYQYYGAADSLTHLGWTRNVAAAEFGPHLLFYPATHTTAVFISELSGVPLTMALMLVVPVVVLVFVSFMSLTAWYLTRDRTTTAIAAFSAFMLLPINNVSTHLDIHPVSLAILFSPVMLYLAARYMAADDGGTGWTSAPRVLALFGLAAAGAVLYHPQLAFVVLVLFATITAVQYVVRRRQPLNPIADTRSLALPTAITGILFLAWTVGRPRFESSAENFVTNVEALLSGSQMVAGTVGQRGASLTALGSGLPEIFAKLFLVSAVYAAVAAMLVILAYTGRLSSLRARTRAYGLSVGIGLVPVIAIGLLYLVANIGTQAFRYFGFVMVVVTLLGTIGLGRFASDADRPTRSRLSRGSVAVVIVVGLLLSLAVAFPSPFIYKSTPHVTESEMTGYERAFERTPDAAIVRSVRDGPRRWADATYGYRADHTRYGGIDGAEFQGGVAGAFPGGDWYLLLSDAQQAREVGAYGEVRYSRESFETARTSSETSRIMSNGDVEVYHVDG